MDVFVWILFAFVLKGTYGNFHVNSTRSRCISLNTNRILTDGSYTIKKGLNGAIVLSVDNSGTSVLSSIFGSRIKNTTVNKQDGIFTFCLINTIITDGGEYSILFSNTDIIKTKLYILGKPKTPNITLIQNGILESEKGILSCLSLSTSNPRDLTFNYTWLVNDTIINNEKKYKCNANHICNELIITVDTNDRFDNYRCLAKEQYGQTSDLSEIGKIEPTRKPNITLLPSGDPYKIIIHQTLTIECVVLDAYPNVTSWTWKKDEETISGHIKYFYKIENVTRMHAAKYECTASNGISNGTAYINVDVLYGPTVKPMPTVSQVEGGIITQECSVLSNPPAESGNVTWTKQGNSSFFETGFLLTINPVNKSDQGKFICTVSILLQPTIGTSLIRSDNNTMQINILYGPTIILRSTYNQIEGKEINIQCNVQSNPTATDNDVTWTKQGNSSYKQKGLQLSLPSVSKDDMGVFICTAKIILEPTSSTIVVKTEHKNITIYVLYGPTVNTMTTYDQLAGKSINKTCVINSYPPATKDNVIWTKQGNNSFKQTGVQLTIQNITEADHGTFVCTATLTLTPSESSPLTKSDNGTLFINVLYGPKITIMSPYSVIKSGGIYKTCIINSNPLATNDDVTWTKQQNSSFTQKSLQLSIPSTTKHDTGTFVCTVDINFQPSDGPNVSISDSQPLEINVLYGPEILPMNKISQEDGYKIVKACDVNSNPEATDANVAWTKQGNSSFIQNDKKLNITSVNKKDQGTFICNVSIIMRPTDSPPVIESASGNLDIDVLYGPTIEPMIGYSPEERDNLTIPCIVMSNPPAKDADVTWTKQNDSSFIKYGLQLSLLSIDKLDHGTYVCKATITLEITDQFSVNRTGTRTVLIDVLYQPILSLSGGNAVFEGNSTTAYCVVDSNPLSNITWTYLPTNTNVPESNIEFYSQRNMSSELKFEPARCENTGPYRCQASNNIKFPASKTVSIDVKCKPRLSSLESTVQNITIGRNESLNHTIEFHAFPVPQCDLKFNKTVVSGFNVGVINHSLPFKSGCRIEKNEIVEADIGPYEITVHNAVGYAVVTFNIIFQREPDPPLLHAIDCIGQPQAASIRWKPQWNGGLEQMFSVQYKAVEDVNFTNGEYFLDDGIKETYEDIIYKLIPGKDYIFKVLASNDKGFAESPQLNCTAIGLDDPETYNLIVIGATTGTIGFIIIFVSSLFVVFIKRRYNHQKSSQKSTKLLASSTDKLAEEQDEEEDGLKPNPMYVSSGQIETDSNRGAIYSVVQKKNTIPTDKNQINGDSSTVYSQVVKNERKGKVKTSTSKIEKKRKPADNKDQSMEMGCVYENSNDIKYEDVDVYANTDTDRKIHVKKEYAPTKNKDGLIYADLDLAPGSNDKRYIIRGLENRNNYAVIDLSITAEPLSSDSDTDDEKDANNIVEKHGTDRQQEQT